MNNLFPLPSKMMHVTHRAARDHVSSDDGVLLRAQPRSHRKLRRKRGHLCGVNYVQRFRFVAVRFTPEASCV